ncbi:Hypothetical predicted protein [Octopus vulgaris]|uniref:Uncharacterized protein n=1 Tax=Octopus vulgaris TaxID=6645 RepID=A0AA36ATI8_OCTVU|nr:Hypothetical predicted protein [Octopus vulgaris]
MFKSKQQDLIINLFGKGGKNCNEIAVKHQARQSLNEILILTPLLPFRQILLAQLHKRHFVATKYYIVIAVSYIDVQDTTQHKTSARKLNMICGGRYNHV